MKIKVNARKLAAAFTKLEVVSKLSKRWWPTVCLADGNKLRILAASDTLHVSISVDAEVEKPGEVYIDGGQLFGMLKHTSGDIVLEEKNGEVIAAKDGMTFSVKTLSADEFAPFLLKSGFLGEVQPQTFPDFIGLVEKVTYARSIKNPYREYLKCVLVEVITPEADTSFLRTVATDGHRLAMASTEKKEGQLTAEWLVAPKELAIISKLIKPRPVTVKWGDRCNYAGMRTEVYLAQGDVEIALFPENLGKFPDYRDLFSQKWSRYYIFNGTKLETAMKILWDKTKPRNNRDKTGPVAVCGGEVVKFGTKADGTKTIFTLENLGNADTRFGVNAKYLMDFCKKAKGNIKIEVTPEKNNKVESPMRITRSDWANFVGLLMPIRLEDSDYDFLDETEASQES